MASVTVTRIAVIGRSIGWYSTRSWRSWRFSRRGSWPASEVLEHHGFHCEFGVPRVHSGDLPVGIAVRMATANGPIDVVLSMAKTGRFKRVI